MSKQDRYTKSARGKPCQIRIYGVCNHDESTVVPAHLNGAGMGIKASSIHYADGCFRCHAAVDGRIKTTYSDDQLKLWHLEGVIRTQERMIRDGVLKL